MKKKIVILSAALILIGILLVLAFVLFPTEAENQYTYELDAVEFEQMLETSVQIGDELDLLSKIKVVIVDNKTSERKEVSVTPDMVTGDFSADTAGIKTITIKYNEQEIEYSFTVKYTVKFEANGDIIDTQKILSLDELEFPNGTIYTKQGMKFVGWTPNVPEKIEDNMVFVAQYIPDITSEYKVTYGQKLEDIQLPTNSFGKWIFVDDLSTLVGNVGTKEFNVKFISNLSGAEEILSKVKVIVSKAKLEFKDLKLEFTYDGTAKFPTYMLDINLPVIEMGEKGINVGTYDFTLIASSDCYDAAYIGQYTIKKAQATITIPDYEFNYDQVKTFNPAEYLVSGADEDLLGEITLSKPSITGQGEYSIEVEIENIDNIELTVNGGNITVGKADLDLQDPTLAEGSVAIFGDVLSLLNLSEHSNGVWSWKNPELIIDTAGTFTADVIFTPNDKEMYNSAEKTITINVSKKELTINITNVNFVYNGMNQSIGYIVEDGSYDDVVVNIKYNDASFAKNAGTYSVILEIDDERYSGVANAQMTIAKATPTTDFTKEYEISWSPNGRTLGNITLEKGYSWQDSTQSLSDTAIGEYVSYPVIFIPDDKENYETVSGEIKVKMTKAEASITVQPTYTFEYNGNVHEIAGVIPSHTEALLEYRDLNGDLFDLASIINVGTYTFDVYLAETNHYFSTSTRITVIIVNGTYSNVVLPTDIVATYGDTLFDVSLPLSNDGVWTWGYSDLDNVPVGNAGIRSFTAIFTPNDTGYNPFPVNVNITVNKKQLTLNIIEKEFVYDGTEKQVQISIDGYVDSSHDVSLKGNVPATNAGTYYLTISVEDDNYYGSTSVDLIINKALYKPAVNIDFNAVYGDTLADVNLPVDADGIWRWDVPDTTVVGNAGVQRFKAIFVHNDSSNYYDYSCTFDINVAKKSVDIPVIDSKVYTGSTLKADIVTNMLYTVKTNNGGINVGNYNVVLELNNPHNYIWSNNSSEAEVELSFEITKATASVSDLIIKNWTFGDIANVPTYNVSDVYDGEIVLLYTGTTKSGLLYNSLVAPTDVGTYKLTVSISSTDNCDVFNNFVEKEFIIESRKVTVPSIVNKPYTGKTLVADINFSGNLYEIIKNAGGISVGKYPVSIQLIDSVNYEWLTNDNDQDGIVDLEFEITKAINSWKYPISIPSILYNSGEVQYNAIPVFGIDEMIVEFKPLGALDSEYTTTKPTEVGAYIARFTIAETENYSSIIEEISFSISTADNGWKTEPTISKDNWIYGETPATINKGTVEFGEIKITINGEPYISMPTDVGTYVVRVYVEGNENFKGIEKTFTLHIDKKVVTLPDVITTVYNNNPQSSTFYDENEIWSAENVTVTDAGTYSVKLTLNDHKNYIWSIYEDGNSDDCAYVSFIIEKAKVTAPTVISTVTYNGKSQNATSDSTLYTIIGYEVNERINVDNYKVYLALTDQDNYEWEGAAESTLSITAATTTTITDFTIKGWVYNSFNEINNMPSAYISNIEGVNIRYMLNGTTEATPEVIASLAPGTYKLVAIVDATSNYAAAQKEIEFTIEKISVIVPDVSTKYTYTGKSITVPIAISDFYTITTNSGYINAGQHNVVLTLNEPEYYKWSSDASGTNAVVNIPFNVGKATASISTVNINGWTYGNYNVTVNIPSADGAFYDGVVSFMYTGTTFAGKAYSSALAPTEAGNYTLIASIAETTNCYGTTSSKNFTVAKQKVDVPICASKIYTGEKLYPDLGANKALFNDIDGAINAGTYYLDISLKDVHNYEWSSAPLEPKQVIFIIDKVSTTLTITVENTIYNGLPYAGIDVVTNREASEVKYEYSLSKTNWIALSTVPMNAGTYWVKAIIEESTNYTRSETTPVEFTINQATPEVLFPDYNGNTVYQNNITIDGEVFGVDGSILSGQFRSDKDVKYTPVTSRLNQIVIYTVTFTPTDTQNYTTVATDIIVILKPAAYIGSSPNSAMWYGSIEDALEAAESGDVVWAVMDLNDIYSGGNTIKNNCTIPENVTLVVPYAEGVRNTSYEATLHGVHTYTNGDYGYQLYLLEDTDANGDGIFQPTDVYFKITNTLTVAPNVIITNNGLLEVSGEISGGNGGSPYSSFTAGASAQLILSENARIDSTGTINTFGFIEESYKDNGSTITVKYGEIYIPSVIRDHRGGTRISGVAMKGEGLASPFNRLMFCNVMPKLIIEYNGAVKGIANMFADGKQNHTVSNIIGKSDLAVIQFTSTSSYLVAKYDKDKEISKLDLYGGARTNGLTISAAGNNVNTKDFAFAIPYHFDISLKLAPGQDSTSYTIGQLMKLMPGAKIVVDQGVTVNVYKMNILGKDYVDPCDTLPYPNNGVNSINAKTEEILEGGMLIIFGHLNVIDSIGGKVYIAEGGTSNDLTGKSCYTKELKTASRFVLDSEFVDYNQTVEVINNNIKVTLDSNGGSQVDNITILNGVYPKLPTPTRYGYSFLGWYNGEVQATEGAIVTSSHTLTARWQENYVVSFDSNGGNDIINIIVTDGKYPTLPTISKPGFTFLGWFNGNIKVNAGDAVTSSHTLTARWSEKKVAIVYNTGSTTIINTVYYGLGDSYVYSIPDIQRSGYTLIGWFYNDGTEEVQISNGDSFKSTESHVIYAKWEKVNIVVSFDPKGGTDCETKYLALDATTYPALLQPTRTGYKFLGWYYDGVEVKEGDALKSTDEHFLTAKWKKLIAVSFDMNGASGTGVETIYVDPDGDLKYPNLPNASDSGSIFEGKKFDGWATSSSGETRVKSGDSLISTEDHVLYAQWKDSCITPDTLITLADGTQVRVDSLTGNELLLVWNMQTGKFDFAPIMFIDSDSKSVVEVISLYFSDGTVVKVISEHGFWDYNLNKYVYLDRNANQYIGHYFAKQNGDVLEKVQLINVVVEKQATTAWSPVTEGHLCYFVNGMLSMPGGVGGLFNIFDVDSETMKYDEEAMIRDIETYGLYTYEELNAIVPLSEEMFNVAGGAYMKISIGKGNITMKELIIMIERYSKFFE